MVVVSRGGGRALGMVAVSKDGDGALGMVAGCWDWW